MTGTLHALGFLLIALSMISLNVCAQDADVCTVPGTDLQSKCIRWYDCESFKRIVSQYNGRLPPAENEKIQKHSCGKNQLVCCPDGATPATTKPSTTSTQRPVASLGPNDLVTLPSPSNLNDIKNHPNINLLNQKCGSSTSDRILGGTKAKPGQFPWMALLQYRLLDGTVALSCGGTLISQFYVLTAAHCILRDLFAVRLGEHDLNTDPDCVTDEDSHSVDCQDKVQDIPIEKVFKHKLYSNKNKINDIALLRLKTAADTTKKNVKIICLPTTEENQIDKLAPPAQKSMFISGWGRTENGQRSDILMKATVPYVKNSDCVQQFASLAEIRIHPTFLCAGGANKTDTCHGDSGGPIQTLGYLNGQLPRMFLYGVVSVGIDCLNPDKVYPGIYTNVAYYLDWILDNMSQ